VPDYVSNEFLFGQVTKQAALQNSRLFEYHHLRHRRQQQQQLTQTMTL